MDAKISNDNLIPKEITQFDNSKLSTREEVSVSQVGRGSKTVFSYATYDSGYLIYYILFLAPLTFRLFKSEKIRLALIYIFLFFLTVFTGLRYEIGGDWLNYHEKAISSFFFTSDFTYLSLLNSRDFLWDASTYFSLYVGGGLILHNYLMALIFYICLHQYIKKFPFYEIALIISFPIFTLFLQMGFARQAMGVAFGLLAINALINKKTGKYILWIIIGSLFHITTLFYLILYLIKVDFTRIFRSKLFKILLLSLVIISFFYFFYGDYINRLFYYYIGEGSESTESQGSIYRTGLNLVSGMVYLLLIFRKIENNEERKIYYILSLTAIFFFILQFNLSTFADRLSFYVTPLQLFTWCHLLKFIKDKKIQNISLFSILSVYLLLIVVWLNYGTARYSFIPYSNFIINNCNRTDPLPQNFEYIGLPAINKWDHARLYTDICTPSTKMNRSRLRVDGILEIKKLKWFDNLKYFTDKQNIDNH